MVDTTVLVLAILSALLILVAGHILIAIVLPRLRSLLLLLWKDEKVGNSIVTILFVMIAVYVLQALIKVLLTLSITEVNYINVLSPGLEMMANFLPVLGWVLVAVIIALGVKR